MWVALLQASEAISGLIRKIKSELLRLRSPLGDHGDGIPAWALAFGVLAPQCRIADLRAEGVDRFS